MSGAISAASAHMNSMQEPGRTIDPVDTCLVYETCLLPDFSRIG